MRDYSKWMNPRPIPKKPQQEPIQQYHYDAMFKVQLIELSKVFYSACSEYLPKDFYKEISHEPFQHYAVNSAHMRGIVKQYGSVYRRYTLDFNGVWHEVDFAWHTGIGNEVTEDTIKAFILDIRDERHRTGGKV